MREKEKCEHRRRGTRYVFSPSADEKVIAVTYCKDCGKEIFRSAVAIKTGQDEEQR